MCCSTTKNLIYPLVSSMSIRVSLSFNSFILPIFKFPGNMNMYFIEYLTSGKYNAYRKGNNSGVCIMYIYSIHCLKSYSPDWRRQAVPLSLTDMFVIDHKENVSFINH